MYIASSDTLVCTLARASVTRSVQYCPCSMVVFWVASLACCVLATVGSPTPPTADPRYLPNGMMMLESGYLDQPYCVIDRHHGNRWVCAITEDRQQEGGPGERVLR